MQKILIINGPNLNMLGQREQDIYGKSSLDDLRQLCTNRAQSYNMMVDFRQTNSEEQIINWLQNSLKEGFTGLIINPAAFSHSSIAIHDALKLLSITKIEVHLSNIFTREEFRHHSYASSVVHGVICGLGFQGYTLAIDYIKGAVKHV